MNWVRLLAASCAFVVAVPVFAEEASLKQGELAAYVAKADDSFRWVKRRDGKLGRGTYVELIVTSQTWRGIVWKHQLFLYKPAELAPDAQAILLIDGGAWNERYEQPPGEGDSLPNSAKIIALAADQLKAPVAVLRQVPQQPIFGGLVEDEIISLTFAKYLETGEADWPLLLPMVKSAVRGMDAVQQFAKEQWSLDITKFTVTGASKRGWTTWLTAVVDSRVAALAPMVIDMLNMAPQMKHQVASFGAYSNKLDDYTSKNLQAALATEAGNQLRAVVDPYSYRQQLTQPKLVMLGTNDQYWPVDALNLYWDGLVGEKYILYVPNNGHGLNDYPRVIGSLAALHQAATQNQPLPRLTWSASSEGKRTTVKLTSEVAPSRVLLWTATAPTRDFRQQTWKSREVQPSEDGSFALEVDQPAEGCVAAFGEAMFDGEPLPFFLSTTMHVLESEKDEAK